MKIKLGNADKRRIKPKEKNKDNKIKLVFEFSRQRVHRVGISIGS